MNTYVYIYISPKIYLLGSGYVLDIPFLTAYIITCWSSCSTTAGKYLFRRECRYKTTYTHTFTYDTHAFGYSIVTLAGC